MGGAGRGVCPNATKPPPHLPLHKTFTVERSVNVLAPQSCVVLSFVDVHEAPADVGKVRAHRRKLVPTVAHQLQQLSVVDGVVQRDRRTKRRRLSATHAHEYICPRTGKRRSQLKAYFHLRCAALRCAALG